MNCTLHKNETMKMKPFLSILLLLILMEGCADSDKEILLTTNNKLQKMKTVQYQSKIEKFDSYSVELLSIDSSSVFFGFNSSDSLIGASYLFSKPHGDVGFDGSIAFYTMKEKQQLYYTSINSPDDLIQGFFNYSILQLRNLLPQLLQDTSILINRQADTIIDKTQCYQYAICLHNHEISLDGKLAESYKNLTTRNDKGDFRYCLLIDKKDNLPKQFIVYSYKNTPFRTVTFSNFNFSPQIDVADLDYSKRDPNFVKTSLVDLQSAQLKSLPSTNIKAKDWNLPSMAGDSIQLSKLNSNLILLEFWFPGCKGCAEAIPYLNAIQIKYKNKGLQVFGIEYTREDSTGLASYISKMKIEFPTLYFAKEMAKDYKVSVAPTFFLINNQDKVVYKRIGFFREELINEIEKYLK